MKASVFASIIVVCALLLPALPAHSASFRCGIHIVQGGGRHGPRKYEILKKCGEPAVRRSMIWIYRHRGDDWQLTFDGNGLLLTVRQLR